MYLKQLLFVCASVLYLNNAFCTIQSSLISSSEEPYLESIIDDDDIAAIQASEQHPPNEIQVHGDEVEDVSMITSDPALGVRNEPPDFLDNQPTHQREETAEHEYSHVHQPYVDSQGNVEARYQRASAAAAHGGIRKRSKLATTKHDHDDHEFDEVLELIDRYGDEQVKSVPSDERIDHGDDAGGAVDSVPSDERTTPQRSNVGAYEEAHHPIIDTTPNRFNPFNRLLRRRASRNADGDAHHSPSTERSNWFSNRKNKLQLKPSDSSLV